MSETVSTLESLKQQFQNPKNERTRFDFGIFQKTISGIKQLAKPFRLCNRLKNRKIKKMSETVSSVPPMGFRVLKTCADFERHHPILHSAHRQPNRNARSVRRFEKNFYLPTTGPHSQVSECTHVQSRVEVRSRFS